MVWHIPKHVFYFSLGATTVGTGYLLKDYFGGTKYKGDEKLQDKVVIITGANTGIGRVTAEDLAKRGAKVILACRNMEKCEMARHQIVVKTRNKFVYCRPCDLASQESIRKFVKKFKEDFSRLDILINNAGVMRCPKSYTEEGIELQLGVNHMGHFLLTNLLLDVLKQSAPSRIINVSSAAHMRGNIKLNDLNSDENYDSSEAYAQSKLANILFTRELGNKLKGTGVTVNAVHPGIVNTEITRHMYVYNNFITKLFLKPFTWICAKTPTQGMQTILYAALDPSLQDVTGTYFSNCTAIEPSDKAKDDKLARWLWLVSEKWTKLNTAAS